MSGSIGLFTQGLQQINLDGFPQEGPYVVAFSIPWISNPYGNTFPISLESAAQTNRFTRTQSIFIDNSTCPNQVSITAQDTGHTIRIEAFAEGLFTLLTGASPRFSVTLSVLNSIQSDFIGYTSVTTKLYILNVPVHPYDVQVNEFGGVNSTILTAQTFAGIVNNATGWSNALLPFPAGGGGGSFNNLQLISWDIDIIQNIAPAANSFASLYLVEAPSLGAAILQITTPPQVQCSSIAGRSFVLPTAAPNVVLSWQVVLTKPYLTKYSGNSIWGVFQTPATTGIQETLTSTFLYGTSYIS